MTTPCPPGMCAFQQDCSDKHCEGKTFLQEQGRSFMTRRYPSAEFGDERTEDMKQEFWEKSGPVPSADEVRQSFARFCLVVAIVGTLAAILILGRAS